MAQQVLLWLGGQKSGLTHTGSTHNRHSLFVCVTNHWSVNGGCDVGIYEWVGQTDWPTGQWLSDDWALFSPVRCIVGTGVWAARLTGRGNKACCPVRGVDWTDGSEWREVTMAGRGTTRNWLRGAGPGVGRGTPCALAFDPPPDLCVSVSPT
jgi:hypothetical protein